MGACGCIEKRPRAKLTLADGSAVLIADYHSCDYCESPTGVVFHRVEPGDFNLWDVDYIPEMKFSPSDMAIVELTDPSKVRQAIRENITGIRPEDGVNGAIDEVYADIVAEETIPDLSGCAVDESFPLQVNHATGVDE